MDGAEIFVHGQKVTLVKRKCKGCPKIFRVHLKSKQKYHSLACEEWSTGKKLGNPI